MSNSSRRQPTSHAHCAKRISRSGYDFGLSDASDRRSLSLLLRMKMRLFLALSTAATLSAQPGTFPPWSRGANNPALDKGYEFQVPDIDNVSDLHGNPNQALLVLFIAGNQFMVMPGLIRAFEAEHPDLRGRVFYETLPPGILRKQIGANGTITLGNFTLQVQPDVFEAELNAVREMEKAQIVDRLVAYATNDLEIMVRRGNPLNIRSLSDLAEKRVRLSMPNPEWEGVARQIATALEKAGGTELVDSVMQQKTKVGLTFLTQIHHRQTPMRILNGQSDAGITWASEVVFQEQIGNPLQGVRIPAAQNISGTYSAAMFRNTPHRKAAIAWLSFLGSAAAQKIYAAYGFKAVSADSNR
jgi:ABC-type molybdate transport system substrate-binding protein